eukprot:1142668-Pelagomonas_calceolata.AAC.2
MPSSRARGALGRPGQPGVNFSGSRQTQGFPPNEWGFAKKQHKGCQEGQNLTSIFLILNLQDVSIVYIAVLPFCRHIVPITIKSSFWEIMES